MTKQKRGAQNPLVGIIVGLLFAILGIGMMFFGWNMQSTFVERATGKVIDVVSERKEEDGRKKTMYYSVIEFTTANAVKVQFQDDVGGSNEPPYRRGETVTVLYDPKNPKKATVDSFMSHWLPMILVIGLGGVFALLGLAWLIGTVRNLVGGANQAQSE